MDANIIWDIQARNQARIEVQQSMNDEEVWNAWKGNENFDHEKYHEKVEKRYRQIISGHKKTTEKTN